MTITALGCGGFVVSSMYDKFVQDRGWRPLFACSTLGEALEFVMKELAIPATTPTDTGGR